MKGAAWRAWAAGPPPPAGRPSLAAGNSLRPGLLPQPQVRGLSGSLPASPHPTCPLHVGEWHIRRGFDEDEEGWFDPLTSGLGASVTGSLGTTARLQLWPPSAEGPEDGGAAEHQGCSPSILPGLRLPGPDGISNDRDSSGGGIPGHKGFLGDLHGPGALDSFSPPDRPVNLILSLSPFHR